MIVCRDVDELEIALHRKLLNVNQDLRTERKKKNSDIAIISDLKSKCKLLDRTLSRVKLLKVTFSLQDYNE